MWLTALSVVVGFCALIGAFGTTHDIDLQGFLNCKAMGRLKIQQVY
jgi:hypothetical protein